MAKWREHNGTYYRYNAETGEVLARVEPIFVCDSPSQVAHCPSRVDFDAPYVDEQGALVRGTTKRYIDHSYAIKAVEETYK